MMAPALPPPARAGCITSRCLGAGACTDLSYAGFSDRRSYSADMQIAKIAHGPSRSCEMTSGHDSRSSATSDVEAHVATERDACFYECRLQKPDRTAADGEIDHEVGSPRSPRSVLMRRRLWNGSCRAPRGQEPRGDGCASDEEGNAASTAPSASTSQPGSPRREASKLCDATLESPFAAVSRSDAWLDRDGAGNDPERQKPSDGDDRLDDGAGKPAYGDVQVFGRFRVRLSTAFSSQPSDASATWSAVLSNVSAVEQRVDVERAGQAASAAGPATICGTAVTGPAAGVGAKPSTQAGLEEGQRRGQGRGGSRGGGQEAARKTPLTHSDTAHMQPQEAEVGERGMRTEDTQEGWTAASPEAQISVRDQSEVAWAGKGAWSSQAGGSRKHHAEPAAAAAVGTPGGLSAHPGRSSLLRLLRGAAGRPWGRPAAATYPGPPPARRAGGIGALASASSLPSLPAKHRWQGADRPQQQGSRGLQSSDCISSCGTAVAAGASAGVDMPRALADQDPGSWLALVLQQPVLYCSAAGVAHLQLLESPGHQFCIAGRLYMHKPNPAVAGPHVERTVVFRITDDHSMQRLRFDEASERYMELEWPQPLDLQASEVVMSVTRAQELISLRPQLPEICIN